MHIRCEGADVDAEEVNVVVVVVGARGKNGGNVKIRVAKLKGGQDEVTKDGQGIDGTGEVHGGAGDDARDAGCRECDNGTQGRSLNIVEAIQRCWAAWSPVQQGLFCTSTRHALPVASSKKYDAKSDVVTRV